VQDKILDGRSRFRLWCILFVSLYGCAQDGDPSRAENEVLKKQVAKQESLLSSLQDGNRVMQQQIDLLNQELRDAKDTKEELEKELAETKQIAGLRISQS
jgi:uncharacterized protein YlxW (UPF0749 family)